MGRALVGGLLALMVGCGGPSNLAEVAEECSHGGELSCPRPILNVHDLATSQEYYRNALGFQLDWEHGEPPDFASVSRGDATIFMCEGCQGMPGAWMMVFARDVDSLYEEIRKRGARIRMPPKDMPWGIRELHVADPDGNVIRFGSSIE